MIPKPTKPHLACVRLAKGADSTWCAREIARDSREWFFRNAGHAIESAALLRTPSWICPRCRKALASVLREQKRPSF
jgi:hypothetical protein